jgi:hypothetical protein
MKSVIEYEEDQCLYSSSKLVKGKVRYFFFFDGRKGEVLSKELLVQF